MSSTDEGTVIRLCINCEEVGSLSLKCNDRTALLTTSRGCSSFVILLQTLTTRDCKGPQTNMPKNVGSIKT